MTKKPQRRPSESLSPAMVYRLCVVVLTIATCHLYPAAAAEDSEKRFQAGAATSNITPPLGLSIAGHMRDRLAQHVHDDLFVRCLVLDDGETRLAFAIVDSCMIPRAISDEAKGQIFQATKIPSNNILIAATHTHSAPCSTPVFQSDPDPDYQKFLVSRIADGVARAAHNLEPARIAWGAGHVPDEVFNRRWFMKPGTVPADPFGKTTDQVKMNPSRGSEDLVEPAGPTDPEIAFIALQNTAGQPIAVLANYSLHYVGGTRAGEISADYFGIFAKRIQELLGADGATPPFVGIMTNGTSGNINNIDFRNPGKRQEPYEQMTVVARKAAAEVFRKLQGASYQDWVPLSSMQEEILLDVRHPTLSETERALDIVDAADGPEMKSYAEIYARETLLLNEYPKRVSVLLQTFRLGALAIAAIPCEVFVETGLNLKEASPFEQTFTIELANGYNGYLPTAKQHALGGYETWRARSSYLEVAAERKIVRSILGLFEGLKPR